MLEGIDDVSSLLHYLILKTIDKELRFKQVSHDDVRVAHLLVSHFPEGDINFVFVAVDLVLKVSVNYV